MIKFLAMGDTSPLLGVGLTRRNCEQLLAGEPIVIDLALQLLEASIQGKFDLNLAKLVIVAEESDEILLKHTLEAFPVQDKAVWLPESPEETNDGGL